MFRLVLFDIDGTLIQTDGAGRKAFAHVCREEFSQPDGTSGLEFAGRTDTAIVHDFFRRHDIEVNDLNVARFIKAYLIRLEDTLKPGMGRVLPGIGRWLEVLGGRASEVATGLLTGNVREGARIKLSHYGLWEHFRTGAYGDDHEDRNKVAAVALERGREFLRKPLRGEELLVLGDTPQDVTCARAIGAKVVAVATGNYRSEELKAHEPDWLVEDLEQLNPETVLEGNAKA